MDVDDVRTRPGHDLEPPAEPAGGGLGRDDLEGGTEGARPPGDRERKSGTHEPLAVGHGRMRRGTSKPDTRVPELEEQRVPGGRALDLDVLEGRDGNTVGPDAQHRQALDHRGGDAPAGEHLNQRADRVHQGRRRLRARLVGQAAAHRPARVADADDGGRAILRRGPVDHRRGDAGRGEGDQDDQPQPPTEDPGDAPGVHRHDEVGIAGVGLLGVRFTHHGTCYREMLTIDATAATTLASGPITSPMLPPRRPT